MGREAALGELARRYLAGHAPAADRDLARWAGIPLGEARRGLGGVAGLVDRGAGLVALSAQRSAVVPPPPLELTTGCRFSVHSGQERSGQNVATRRIPASVQSVA